MLRPILDSVNQKIFIAAPGRIRIAIAPAFSEVTWHRRDLLFQLDPQNCSPANRPRSMPPSLAAKQCLRCWSQRRTYLKVLFARLGSEIVYPTVHGEKPNEQ
jgi:hypothetical protein